MCIYRKGLTIMATIQERAITCTREALHFDEATEQEIMALVPSSPLSLVGLPYWPACESELYGACGGSIVSRSRRAIPCVRVITMIRGRVESRTFSPIPSISRPHQQMAVWEETQTISPPLGLPSWLRRPSEPVSRAHGHVAAVPARALPPRGAVSAGLAPTASPPRPCG